GSGADTLFNYFEISVTEHVPGGDVIYGVDDDYYFKNDKAFTLDIPISGALTSFLQSVGLPINLAQLAFTYIVGPAASATFVGAGIETVLTNDTFGFRAIHLSKFGGGRGKLATGIEEKYFEIIPDDYLLAQNYPNPFNPTTTIKFSIPKQEQVSLSIYTATGELVEELISGQKAAGTYEVTFNAENLASGIYIYKLRTASTDLSKKMLLVK
ncbi:MAG: T9SS type A sorting domain-containing protein, partial [Melioribacteraceae bacterium]|nr:T9SS type A sorting domain-containing protein [Melioribacteraceae bacterium]